MKEHFAYKDYQTDFGSLLKQRSMISIHVKNLQLLKTEMYKTRSGLSPPFMKDIFADRKTGLRSEWPSGPASSISLTEVKHGCVRSETGWASFR